MKTFTLTNLFFVNNVFTMKQSLLAKKLKISLSHLSNIANRNRIPSLNLAILIAKHTETDPSLWSKGTKAQRKKAIREA